MVNPKPQPPGPHGALENLVERSPIQSKKFIAFLLSQVTWTLLMAAMLIWVWWTDKDDLDVLKFGLLLSIIVGNLFLQVAYICSQAAVDAFVRLAGKGFNLLGPVSKKVLGPGKDPDENSTFG